MIYNDTTKHKKFGCNPLFQSTKQQLKQLLNAEKWDVGYLPGVGWAVLIVLLLSSVFGRRLAWPLSKLRFPPVHKVKKLSCVCSCFVNVSLCCIDMSCIYVAHPFCALRLSLPTKNPVHIRRSSDLFISTTKLYFIYLWDNCQYIVCVCMSEWQRDEDFTS